MTDFIEDQYNFMQQSGQIGKNEINLIGLYKHLVQEEYEEWSESMSRKGDIKEACDILVVASGYLIAILGKDKAKRAWELVHESNMEKTRGNIETREDGKILKSDEWKRTIKAKLMSDIQALIDK